MLWLAVLITLVFGVAVLATHQPFLADDYWWLWLSLHHPHFGWTEPYMFARMPVATTLAVAALKTGVVEAAPRLFLIATFACYAFAFAILFQTLLERASLKLKLAPFLTAGAVIALFPSNYEIALWHFNSLHALGALLIALSFRERRTWLRVATATVGLLEYDTFIFLLLGFSGLELLLDQEIRNQTTLRRRLRGLLIPIGVPILLAVVTKVALGRATGFLQVVPMARSGAAWAHEFPYVLRNLWVLHFYKATWSLTPFVWIAVGFLAWLARGKIPRARLALILTLPTLVALPLCANLYPAPRAFFGPNILQALVFAFLAYVALTLANRKQAIMAFGAVGILGLAFGFQWAEILKIKNRNFALLELEQTRVALQIKDCKAPCQLTLPPPGEGVARDWVLPEFVWPFYYDRLRLIHEPTKHVEIRIAKPANGGA